MIAGACGEARWKRTEPERMEMGKREYLYACLSDSSIGGGLS